MQFSSETTINASAEKVWAILTDGSKYPEWDPGMVKIDGTIAFGNKITAYTKISPDRAFPVNVSTFDVNRKMVWSSKMPLGAFKGERSFVLTDKGNGQTHVSVKEVFSGWMLPVIGRTIPDLSQSFTDFTTGLKQRAESAV